MTYLAYAGIGSRKTPPHIRTIMTNLATHLAFNGWVLRSGGADGADTAFEKGVDAFMVAGKPFGAWPYDQKEIYLPWRGFNNNPSQLHPGNYPFSEQETELASQYHPAWNKCAPAARKMHTRNLRQIVGHPSVAGPTVQLSKFVVCWTEGGQGQGGTGQALRMARSMDIPIVDLGAAYSPNDLEFLVNKVEELRAKFQEA